MVSFFTRNPYVWVPFSTKISLNRGPFFQNFWMFTMQTPQNCEKLVYILREENPLKMGTLFQKWPLKMGRGFEAPAAHLRPNQIWVPPGNTYANLISPVSLLCIYGFVHICCTIIVVILIAHLQLESFRIRWLISIRKSKVIIQM